jgi:hypothetical protein
MSQSFFGFFLLGALVIIGVLLLIIFFNLTLQRSMAVVSKKNQPILPGLIWLNLIPIPILNTVWTMIFGIVTCNAMNKEAGRKIAPINLAIAYSALSLLVSILSVLSNLVVRSSRGPNEIIELIIGLASIASIVLWIIFWVQINSAKNKLKGISLSSGDDESLDSGFIDDEL